MKRFFLLLSATFFMPLVLSGAYAIPVDTTDITDNAGSLLYTGMLDGGNQSNSDEISFIDQENGAAIPESLESLVSATDELDLETFVQSLQSGDEKAMDRFLTTEGLAIMAWEAGEIRTRIASQSSPPTSASTGTRRSIGKSCLETRASNSRKLRSSWEEICPDGGSIGSGSGSGKGVYGGAGKQAGGGGIHSPGMRPFRGNPHSGSGGRAGGSGAGVPVNNDGDSRGGGGGTYRPSDPDDTGGNGGGAPAPGDSGGNPGWGTGGDWNEIGDGEGVPPSEIVEIPVPSTLVLLVPGLICLIASRRSRLGLTSAHFPARPAVED